LGNFTPCFARHDWKADIAFSREACEDWDDFADPLLDAAMAIGAVAASKPTERVPAMTHRAACLATAARRVAGSCMAAFKPGPLCRSFVLTVDFL
jgi:hypothetical protein